MPIMNRMPPNMQSGFATVLIVLLVGLAVAASALGTAYYINTSQRTLVSSHALTNAQSGAWSGVEIFRKYLLSREETDLTKLDGQNLVLNVQDGKELKINNITSTQTSTAPNIYRVTAKVQNISDNSAASSTIQVVYEISFTNDNPNNNGNSGNVTTFPSAMNFYGDLDANGGITISNAGDRAVVNVAGSFSTGSGLTGIKELKVMGNVNISGGGITGLENIYSNGNVTLNASGTANLVSAKGKVETSGGVTAKDIYADGDVTYGSSGTSNSIDTKGSITVSGGATVNKATAGKTINVGNGTINTSLANSDINYAVWNSLQTSKSGGTFYCKSPWWNSYTSISAVSFSNCPTDTSKLIKLAAGTQVAFPTGALATVSLNQKPIINASYYETQANYTLSLNNQNQIMVYVRSVNGVPEGSYHLAKLKKDNKQSWGYLCKTVDSNNFCTSNVVANFGNEKGYVNEIITYSNGVWTVNDNQQSVNSIASGIVFFKGSLKLVMGKYVNTFISTGNIEYGTSITLTAPNYADASQTCGSTYYPMPTNLCSSTTALSYASLGNTALLAGSCTDSSTSDTCSSTYVGGDISFGSSATVYGNIIAGNKITTSGSTNIKGSMLAAALGQNSGSTFGGGTTIDMNGLGEDKTTITVPSNEEDDNQSESTTERVKIKWARYI
ncbi:FapA family protein [Acinetobacter ursingii]|uniref:FapA family protein n=1 Tax=Acinetobacter ursingii TaxID=108980 RepID=UPI0021CD2D71|nr:FapA family protein [Acinetobacter ursingii]